MMLTEAKEDVKNLCVCSHYKLCAHDNQSFIQIFSVSHEESDRIGEKIEKAVKKTVAKAFSSKKLLRSQKSISITST